MTYEKCTNCIGSVEVNCATAREAAAMGIEQIDGLDPVPKENATDSIVRRVGTRIIEGGCAFTLEQIRPQIAEQSQAT